MQGNPRDLFDGMDGMFARLFSRIDREFMAGSPTVYSYRMIVRDTGESPEIQEIADDADPSFRVRGEPVAEVHRIGNEVKVIADLPGITEEALRLDLKGGTLSSLMPVTQTTSTALRQHSPRSIRHRCRKP